MESNRTARSWRDIVLPGDQTPGAVRKVSEAGGSLRDVQQLAGHASLQTTLRHVEGGTDAKRRLVAMI